MSVGRDTDPLTEVLRTPVYEFRDYVLPYHERLLDT